MSQIGSFVRVVVKKDGERVLFDIERVISSIERAGKAAKGFDRKKATELANEVLDRLNGSEIIESEWLQDVIEEVLAKSFIKNNSKLFGTGAHLNPNPHIDAG